MSRLMPPLPHTDLTTRVWVPGFGPCCCKDCVTKPLHAKPTIRVHEERPLTMGESILFLLLVVGLVVLACMLLVAARHSAAPTG